MLTMRNVHVYRYKSRIGKNGGLTPLDPPLIYNTCKLTIITGICFSYSPVQSLRANSNLTELRLEKCGLDANDTAQLADVLKDIPSLCVLDLSFNHVNTKGAEHLGG